MVLGFGGQGNKEQRMNRDMFQAELKHEREQTAMQQAGMGDMQIESSRDPDLVRWQEELSDEINLAILDLRRIDKVGDKYKPLLVFKRVNEKGQREFVRAKPILNELGINSFKTFIRPMVSRNLLMSNFKEDQILAKLKNTVISWVCHLAMHYKEYGVEVTNLPMLSRLFKSISEPSCYRALLNGERNYLTSSTRRLEAFTSNEQQGSEKKKGFLQGMMG